MLLELPSGGDGFHSPVAPIRLVAVEERVLFPVAAPLAWDTVWRAMYLMNERALRNQALELFDRGVLTTQAEIEFWCEQRDVLRAGTQSKLSPAGRAFSKWMETVRTPAERVARAAAKLAREGKPTDPKTVYRAVLEGLSKSNWKANAFAFGVGVASAHQIYVEVKFVTHAVATAPPGEGWHAGLREGLGSVGAVWTGVEGAKLGCAYGGLSMLWLFGAGGAVGCVGGAVVGGLGFGYVGRQAGRNAGDLLYQAGEAGWRLVD